MQRNLNSLLLRGLLGLALSLAALATAATQAIGHAGEVRLQGGRLVLLDAPHGAAPCTLATRWAVSGQR